MNGFLGQFGLVSYAMLTLGFIIVAICIERFITFISLPKLKLGLVSGLISAVDHDDKQALNSTLNELGKSARKYILPIIVEPKDIAESELCLRMRKQRQRMQRPLVWLNLFAVISPMLGLLGTIWSMSHSFSALAQSLSGNGLQNMIMYLSEAMYTTAFGIVLALISLLAFYCFRQYAERYLANAEEALNHLMLSLDRQTLRKTQAANETNMLSLRSEAVL